MSPASPSALVRDARILICCGPGGVGKTTSAAALALWAAEHGRRTCVLTIDPARRLAQALGLDELDNTPRPVPGVRDGSLDAMMLDMRSTFDGLVRSNASDPEQAERILSNAVYQRLSSAAAGTQEYMAMEKLHELHSSGNWDLLVVDTPPTRSALDFVDAPRRMEELLDRRLRGLALPVQRLSGLVRGLGLAGSLSGLTQRVTGPDLLREMVTFVAEFDGMYEGFRDRAKATRALLQESSTAFVVLTSTDEAALWEGAFLAGRLTGDQLRLGAVVVNRVSQSITLPRVPVSARKSLLAKRTGDARLLGRLLETHATRAALAQAEQRRVTGLLAAVPATGAAQIQVPLLSDDLTDLPGLRVLGEHLVRE
jgi:anion-transporting  ArsA/GET3 family ATPase